MKDIQEVSKRIESYRELFVELGSKERLNDLETAKVYAVVDELAKSLKNLQDVIGDSIRDKEYFEEQIDDGRVVRLQEAALNTYISTDALDQLKMDEIKKVCNITEKGLKEIGRNDIILNYKRDKGYKKAAIKVHSQKKWQKLQEKKNK